MPKISPQLFHTPSVNQAVSRVMSLARQRGEVMAWGTLLADPAIEEEFRSALSKYKPDSRIQGEEHAKELFETLVKFRSARIMHEVEGMINEGLSAGSFDIETLMADVADKIAEARSASSTEDVPLYHLGVGDNTEMLFEEILNEEKADLLPTGFRSFDAINGGLPSSGLFILAAYTSSLKSAMANQLVMNWYEQGYNVAKASLEMRAKQEKKRLLANMSGVPLSRITQVKMTPDDKEKLKIARIKFIDGGIQRGNRLSLLTPTEDVSLTMILDRLKPYGYKAILVDYITLLKDSDGDMQWLALSKIAREAKIYGDRNNVLIVMLAQLDEDNKIRYSRAIREHADGVWQWSVTDADREAGQFAIKQVKGRDQELITFEVQVDFTTLRITDLMTATTLSEDDPDVLMYREDLGEPDLPPADSIFADFKDPQMT